MGNKSAFAAELGREPIGCIDPREFAATLLAVNPLASSTRSFRLVDQLH